MFLVLTILTLCLGGCEQPTDETDPPDIAGPSLTIENESSYDLSNVTWSGMNFVSSGQADLPKGTAAKKETTENASGYIYFTRKDIGINLRTQLIWTVEDTPVTILDNTTVVEVANESNTATLLWIRLVAEIRVEYDGRIVTQDDIINAGSTLAGSIQQMEFTLKNIGSGALTLAGVAPVNVGGDGADAFSITQPANSNIAPGESLAFTVAFTPPTVGAYVAALTIKSNASSGDFTFTLSAEGLQAMPAIAIFNGEAEVAQNGTITMGEIIVTQSGTVDVSIKNIGEAPLTLDLDNIAITGTHTAAFIMTAKPGAVISAGDTSRLTVQCSPTQTGENSAILAIPTNDNSRNPAVVYLKVTGFPGAAVLELSQDDTVIENNNITPLDFGEIELGAHQSLSFIIKNTGNIDLRLTGSPLIQSNAGVFAVSTQPDQTEIAPGGTASFVITHTPTAEGEESADITIANNSASPQFKFTVKGTCHVRKPGIQIKNGEKEVLQNGLVNVGSIEINSPGDIEITIKNTGDDLLNISSDTIAIAGDDSNAFVLWTKPASTIPALSESKFIIRSNPTRIGEHNAAVSIPNNDTSRNPAVFFIQAEGAILSANMELRVDDSVIENNTGVFNFGTLATGASLTKIFVLKNTGAINLELSGNPSVASSNPLAFNRVV
jgi:hypothetical protein